MRHRPPYLTDPLAPVPEPVLQRRVRRNISAQTNPIIRQIQAAATSGAQNISGISEALASRLQGGQAATADIYNRARTSLEGSNQALQTGLTNQGNDIASGLASRIGLSGADPSVTAALQAASRGAVGAQGVRGSAELGQLTLKQAAGEQYASQLPAFARLGGLQGIRDIMARKQQSLSDLAAKVPGSVAQGLASARRQEYEKAVAARGFGVDFARIGAQRDIAASSEAGRNSRANVTAELNRQKANEQARHNQAMEDIGNQRGDQTAARQAETKRHNKRIEGIQNRRQKTARWKAHHPKGTGGSSGGGGGVGAPPQP